MIAGALCVTVALATLETVYRLHLVPLYEPELRAFNPPPTLSGTDERPTLLALGDSFTASTFSYPAILRERLPEWRVVNGGISGTGIVEAGIVAPAYIERFQPDVLLYQVYAGNDLWNFRRSAAPGAPVRSLYWQAANYLPSLSFLNYRLAQRRADRGERPETPTTDEPFAPDRYTRNERTLLAFEPNLVEAHVRLTGKRGQDAPAWAEHIERLMELCEPPACRPLVVVIPHKAQVTARYRRHLKALGAAFSGIPLADSTGQYPLADYLGERLSAPVLNVLPALQDREAAGTSTYFVNDLHLSVTGQQVVAETIETWIRGSDPRQGRTPAGVGPHDTGS